MNNFLVLSNTISAKIILNYSKERYIMAKNKKQNRDSNKASKNANHNNTNTTNNSKQENNSRNEVKPDDRPRRDGPGGS